MRSDRRGSRLAAPPPRRLCAALGSGTEESAGTRASRGTAPAASQSRVSRQGSHTLEAERKNERAGAGEEAIRPRRSYALSEGARSRAGGLSASIQLLGSWPRLERRARILKTLLPRLLPTFALALRKLGSSLPSSPQRSVGIFPCVPLTKLHTVLPFQQVWRWKGGLLFFF